MFSLFASQEKKMRDNAANWLEMADKVWHFRRDQLRESEAGELRQRTADLRQQCKARADAAKLKLGIEALELVLRRTGGAIYPKSSLVENVEFFLVAAIVILGIRTYFVQPFKIPTNSMWPTYYGMTAENLAPATTQAPGLLEQAFRLVAFGAQRRTVVAPVAGEVSVDVFSSGQIAYAEKPGRTWLIFPATVREYTFYVGDHPATLRVPLDFSDVDRVVIETLFGDQAAFEATYAHKRSAGELTDTRIELRPGVYIPAVHVPVGRKVTAGEPVIRFDLLTGDQLFVDRVSYHFTQPKVGQGFVFRTGNIAGIGSDTYYIKRLVGLPGDTIEIKEPVLYRNGQPIDGAAAFQRNGSRAAPYRGYVNIPPNATGRYLVPGQALTVPADGFFALGDNSRSSLDGRYWGFVPRKDAVGRPLFIYYPFTRRWGPAR